MRQALALAGLAALLLAAPAAAKSYAHPLIEQRFTIRANGDVDVEDVRSYRFDGSFSFATLTIREGGRHGARRVEYAGVWDADSGARQVSAVSRDSKGATIRWSYQAQDGTRRFLIRYRLIGAVSRHPGAAQFYWKVVEDEHAPIAHLRVTVVPPAPSPTLFKVLVHTRASPGTMQFAADLSRMTFALDAVPRDTFVEARVLMDPAVFPALPVDPSETYQGILDEETRNAGRELWVGQLLSLGGRFGDLAALALTAVMVWYFWRTYTRYGREPEVRYDAIYEREPPREIPPAVVPAILTQGAQDNALIARSFAATLLDLARRGYLEVAEQEERSGLLGLGHKETVRFTLTAKGRQALADPARLEPIEAEVLQVVFREVAEGGESVTAEEIQAWGRAFRGRKSNFLLFVEGWGPTLRAWFEKTYFPIDDRSSEKQKGRFIAWDVGYVFLAIVMTFFIVPVLASSGSTLGVLLLVLPVPVAVVLGVAAAKSLSRRTPEAALEVRRWGNFAKFMSDFSAMKDAPATLVHLWDQYLVYAVALGVADRLLENLKMLASQRGEAFAMPVWYLSTQGGGAALSADGLAGLASLSRTLENFHSLSRTLSSSSSSGGGFSGGGGGGGGGGSSSAG